MEFIDVSPSEAVDEADWIGPRLRPFTDFQAGSVIPDGFDAYARLDHEREGVLPREVAEALVAILTRHTKTPNPLWLALWDGYGYVYGPGWSFTYLFAFGPEQDGPHPAQFALRYPPFRTAGTPRIRMPYRDYVLYRGAPERVPGWQDGPNLWWPDDRAWCVSSEIDLPWTFVGGTIELIDEVVGNPGLNARPASLDERVAAEPGPPL